MEEGIFRELGELIERGREIARRAVEGVSGEVEVSYRDEEFFVKEAALSSSCKNKRFIIGIVKIEDFRMKVKYTMEEEGYERELRILLSRGLKGNYEL